MDERPLLHVLADQAATNGHEAEYDLARAKLELDLAQRDALVDRFKEKPASSVTEKQMAAFAELAKYEVTGDFSHLHDAFVLAFDSGYAGDNKTGFLKDEVLNSAFDLGAETLQKDYLKTTDLIFPELGFNVEANGKFQGEALDLFTSAKRGNVEAAAKNETYQGEIYDIDKQGNVFQGIDGNPDGEAFVVHKRSNLSAEQSGLIKPGNYVSVSYLSTGEAIVKPASSERAEVNFAESKQRTLITPNDALLNSLLASITDVTAAVSNERASGQEKAEVHKQQKSRSR